MLSAPAAGYILRASASAASGVLPVAIGGGFIINLYASFQLSSRSSSGSPLLRSRSDSHRSRSVFGVSFSLSQKKLALRHSRKSPSFFQFAPSESAARQSVSKRGLGFSTLKSTAG